MPGNTRCRPTVFRLLVALAATAMGAAPLHAEDPPRLDFEAFVARALRGPRARAARENTNAMRGAHAQAQGAGYPSLSVAGLFAPSPGITCQDVACTATVPREVSISLAGALGRVEVSLIQPVYTFGKLSAARLAGEHAVRAASFREDELRADISVDAARAFFGLQRARELTGMLEDGREEVGKALVRVNEKLQRDAPDVTLQDRLRLETLSGEIDTRLARAREAEEVALAAVRALAGDWEIDIEDAPLSAIDMPIAGQDSYLARALEGRAQLNFAREQAEAAAAMAEYESAGYLPDVVLVAGARVARAQGVDNPPSAFANDPYNTAGLALALSLRWNVDPLAQRGRVMEAQAQARAAEALANVASDAAGYDVRAAFAAVVGASERRSAGQRAHRSARAWLAAALQADAIGTGEAKELADAYLAYFSVRDQWLEAIFDWNVAVISLRRATGEYSPLPRRRRNAE